MTELVCKEFKEESDKAVDVLTGLLRERADEYEFFFSSSGGLTVEAKKGAIDSFRVSSGSGVGLRTLNNGRPGVGFSTVFTKAALTEMVELTIAGSKGASVDEYLCFAGPTGGQGMENDPALGVSDPAFDTGTEEEKIQKAFQIEKSAMESDALIKRVRKASYSETRAMTRTVNSGGVDVSYSGTFYTGSVMAVAEKDGESQVGWEMGMGHGRGDVDCEKIGTDAARRATDLLGGRSPGTVKCPAIFENTVVGEFLGVLSSSFFASNVVKGKSMLADKKNEQVVSDIINIYDDGLLKRGWSSSVYDCEGVPRQRTALIQEGVCQGYLYDTYWAAREGVAVKSTGNGARAGYKGSPDVGISNLYIEKGGKTLKELVSEIGKGLFITEVMGVHTVNPMSGEFSLGAAGMWIENGVPAYPVRGIAISGTLLELFSKVEAVGSDLRFVGSVGAPSLLFGEIEASGA